MNWFETCSVSVDKKGNKKKENIFLELSKISLKYSDVLKKMNGKIFPEGVSYRNKKIMFKQKNKIVRSEKLEIIDLESSVQKVEDFLEYVFNLEETLSITSKKTETTTTKRTKKPKINVDKFIHNFCNQYEFNKDELEDFSAKINLLMFSGSLSKNEPVNINNLTFYINSANGNRYLDIRDFNIKISFEDISNVISKKMHLYKKLCGC